MAQANVYTSASAQAWYTDKARIATGTTSVTYQIDLIYPTATGNLFSAPTLVPPNASQLSSINHKLFCFINLSIILKFAGFPSVCAIIIALVLGEIAS